MLLVAPTTTEKRRQEIARLSSGFIYYLSVSGITGERDKLPENIEANLKQLRGMTDRPVCVGFGISKAAHVAQLRGIADGAIVGRAVVKRMQRRTGEGPEAVAAEVGKLTAELRADIAG